MASPFEVGGTGVEPRKCSFGRVPATMPLVAGQVIHDRECRNRWLVIGTDDTAKFIVQSLGSSPDGSKDFGKVFMFPAAVFEASQGLHYEEASPWD